MTTTAPTKTGSHRLADRAATIARAIRIGRIARWLGPWADPEQMPRAHATIEEKPMRHVRLRAVAQKRSPRAPTAPPILLLPGLHFLGPDDARFRRFGAVLTQTGADVIAPYLSDFLDLALSPRLFDEAHAALALASGEAGGPVGVMSISFGSIAALHLAANAPERVARMVVFGGYRHYLSAVRFALGAAMADFPAEVRDPLNGPAVLVNLVDELLPAAEREPFRKAALEFSRATWSRPGRHDDKRDGRHLRVGRAIAETLSGEAKALFRVAVRLDGDPLPLAERAMAAAGERLAFLDPSPHVPRVRVPVACIHGRDDDVIPWTESEAMARDLPHGRALITGLYGHTGHAGGAAGGPAALVREVRTMAAVLASLADLPI